MVGKGLPILLPNYFNPTNVCLQRVNIWFSPPPCRSAETGEGHFFFTGHYILNLFAAMKDMMTSRARVTDVHTRKPRNDFYEPMSPHINGHMMRTSSAASVSSTGSSLSFHRSDTPRSIEGYDTPRSWRSAVTDSDEDDTSSEGVNIVPIKDWSSLPLSSVKTFPLPSHLASIPMSPSSSSSLPPPLPSRELKSRVLQTSGASTNSLPGSRAQYSPPLSSPNSGYMHISPATLNKDGDYVTMRIRPAYRMDSPREEVGTNGRTQDGPRLMETDRRLVSGTVHARRPSPPIPPNSSRRNSNAITYPRAAQYGT